MFAWLMFAVSNTQLRHRVLVQVLADCFQRAYKFYYVVYKGGSTWFLGEYTPPTLSVNHVGINKDIGKRLPPLHCIKMKICYDPCFIDIRVTMATSWRHYAFYLPLYFSVLGVFFRNPLRELVPPLVSSVVARSEQILWERFGNILKQSFKGH